MFRDYIFDFDGTVSDTYPVFTDALLLLLSRYGIEETREKAYALLKISVGKALGSYRFPKSVNEISREFHEIHTRLATERQKPFPDAEETLKTLTGAGKRCFIYTHTAKLVYVLLDKWQLSRYISDTVDGSMGFLRKPAPDALNYLIEKNNIDKNTALMIGDRDIDIDVGHNADVAACLFDNEGYYPSTKAEFRISSLSGLLYL